MSGPDDIQSPSVYKILWTVSDSPSPVILECHRSWSPLGSDRFYTLATTGFFQGAAFFRVVPDFVAQWGISGDPEVNTYWNDRPIKDDPVGVMSNLKGTVTFATAGPDTRTTQMFVNFKDNTQLDSQGFTPVCRVTSGMGALRGLKNPTPGDSNGLDQTEYEGEGEAYIAPYKESPARVDWIMEQTVPYPQTVDEGRLVKTCEGEMITQAPQEFDLTFRTSEGDFVAKCQRSRFPAQVDRVYNLARLGYYSLNYFFRVVDNSRMGIVQFGTSGVSSVSNVYNFLSPELGRCGVVEPQPSQLSIGHPMESNRRGWISMSTSYNPETNTTWNATAELFINKEDNGDHLDSKLFVPLCKIDDAGMEVVDKFQSFGEVQELGGGGVSLDELYALGNEVITGNMTFNDMALLYAVTLVPNDTVKGQGAKTMGKTEVFDTLGFYLFVTLLLFFCGVAIFRRRKAKLPDEREWRRVSMDADYDKDDEVEFQ